MMPDNALAAVLTSDLAAVLTSDLAAVLTADLAAVLADAQTGAASLGSV